MIILVNFMSQHQRLLFIYLLNFHPPPPLRGWHAPTPRKKEHGMKKREENRYRGTGSETSYPNQAIDAIMGNEEQTRKRKRTNKETLDHSFASYEPHGSSCSFNYLPGLQGRGDVIYRDEGQGENSHPNLGS